MSLWQSIQRHVGAAQTGVPDEATAVAIMTKLGIGGHDGSVSYCCAAELVHHEAIVLEAYKDSEGIWTWAVGVTNASGHQVYPRYKDQPQDLHRCLEVSVWLMREKYAPAVRAAFEGHSLTEAQFAAALSFHYNTGSIGVADWVQLWKIGKVSEARVAFMNWRSPASIIPRREKERDLFFDGKWSQDGTATIYPVAKPSYSPAWGRARRVSIEAELRAAMSAA